MNDEKRKALEAAGWKFGDAEDFLNEGRAMNAEKMRAEFEKWAEAKNLFIGRYHYENTWSYADDRTNWAFDAYQAGRMAVQREAEEWSKRVNKRFIEMQNKLEGEQ